ncbi:SHC-transforming protein 4-like [Scleropages formosus]|uniref:SHC-transforming protein 4-like n=1 Tax=Scleropages formosus TaxID=113540 RepID=UPI0010FA769D|nr:SHC-transforming protein 4-like [Scleropages formosus]
MLHRTKYSRFRNDSVTSLEDSSGGPTALPAVAKPAPCPNATPLPYLAPWPAFRAPHSPTGAPEEGATTLCTLIPRMAGMKINTSSGLLALKGLALSSKQTPRSKLTADCSPGRNPAAFFQSPPHVDSERGSAQPEGLLSFLKPSLGCESHLELGTSFNIRYMGCLEVMQSMRLLDFETRTQVTREAISRLCDCVPGVKAALKHRKPPNKELSAILGKSNLQFSGMNIKLNISTNSLSLTTLGSQQTIVHHHMQSISFASGGDPDTTDYVAYVAKDPVNHRACHILECPDGVAQEVINTIGQAFELRFRQVLNNPSALLATTQRGAVADGGWCPESSEVHQYYNEIPGKQPPPGGLLDMRVKTEAILVSPGGCQMEDEKLQWIGCPQNVSTYENCALTSKRLLSAADAKQGVAPIPVESVEGAEAAYSTLGDASTFPDVLQHIQELLQCEAWYHGQMSRHEAESLLMDSGDFLVRESSSLPGQYVLSGLQGATAKHLLLVDPEGMVRTKDHIFKSVGHLIRYHMDSQRPIVSCGSELCLKQPVVQKQH